jgi:hypothetical protein
MQLFNNDNNFFDTKFLKYEVVCAPDKKCLYIFLCLQTWCYHVRYKMKEVSFPAKWFSWKIPEVRSWFCPGKRAGDHF